eukprot:TRINITY_DN12827_c0_g1_i1.p1 TRINITY_DN12827_c0_g1~~TRINITY_DN12827_c0_g1_i1.p1  ORF type:complete len:617 (+),score=97.93 TRINITY_DN12827_c0_g1_i1:141-1991(+)
MTLLTYFHHVPFIGTVFTVFILIKVNRFFSFGDWWLTGLKWWTPPSPKDIQKFGPSSERNGKSSKKRKTFKGPKSANYLELRKEVVQKGTLARQIFFSSYEFLVYMLMCLTFNAVLGLITSLVIPPDSSWYQDDYNFNFWMLLIACFVCLQQMLELFVKLGVENSDVKISIIFGIFSTVVCFYFIEATNSFQAPSEDGVYASKHDGVFDFDLRSGYHDMMCRGMGLLDRLREHNFDVDSFGDDVRSLSEADLSLATAPVAGADTNDVQIMQSISAFAASSPSALSKSFPGGSYSDPGHALPFFLFQFLLAIACGIISTLLCLPSLRYARCHDLVSMSASSISSPNDGVTKSSPLASFSSGASYIFLVVITFSFIRPLSRSVFVAAATSEPATQSPLLGVLLSNSTFISSITEWVAYHIRVDGALKVSEAVLYCVRYTAVFPFIACRIFAVRPQIQAFLDTALSLADKTLSTQVIVKSKKTKTKTYLNPAERIPRIVVTIYQCLCMVAVQLLQPPVLLLIFACIAQTQLFHLSALGMDNIVFQYFTGTRIGIERSLTPLFSTVFVEAVFSFLYWWTSVCVLLYSSVWLAYVRFVERTVEQSTRKDVATARGPDVMVE